MSVVKNVKKVFLSCCVSPFMKKLNVMGPEETLEYILKNKVSIGRFGDGELMLMNGENIPFQKANKDLMERLKEVKNTENFLVCIPSVFDKQLFNKRLLTKNEYSFWKRDILKNSYYWKKYFNKNSFIGDTELTRFYIRYNDRSNVGNYVTHLKELWDNKNAIIVEGRTSQVGVGNDILDNAQSVRRIICPNNNAFEKYDQILKSVKENYKDGDIVLIALGPTATILAYDLSKSGIWALDMGHFDIEYEWFLAKTEHKIPVKNKHVNEIGDMGSQDKNNVNYLNQIIKEIKNDTNTKY